MANTAFQTVTEVVANSFQNVWLVFMSFIPSLIGALAVLIIGLIVATGLGTVVEKIFEAMKTDRFLGKLGIAPYVERAGLQLRGSYFVGRVVHWFIVIAFLIAASDILNLKTFSEFLNRVLEYIPNVVAAVLILLAAVVIGNFLKRVVTASVLSARLHAAHLLGAITWWSVVVFGFLAALVQLNIAVSIINSIITGFIAMLALAGGLAFGLGGKDYANHLMNKVREVTEKK